MSCHLTHTGLVFKNEKSQASGKLDSKGLSTEKVEAEQGEFKHVDSDSMSADKAEIDDILCDKLKVTRLYSMCTSVPATVTGVWKQHIEITIDFKLLNATTAVLTIPECVSPAVAEESFTFEIDHFYPPLARSMCVPITVINQDEEDLGFFYMKGRTVEIHPFKKNFTALGNAGWREFCVMYTVADV